MSDEQLNGETASQRFKNMSLAVAELLSSIFIPLVGVYFTDRQHESDTLNGAAEEKRQVSLKFIELRTLPSA